jgi:Na+/H+-dicarboxylate symporter
MSLVGVVSFAMALQYLILILMIFVFAKLNPMPFIKKSIPYQMLALSTSSSKATLPTTMQVCREDMGISETSTSFVLPLGASINMDGLAINLGLCAMFFAQVYGVDLSLTDYVVLTLTATLGSIGGAGIPGASLIMLPMVLSSINVPYEGVAILAGVDRILDALRTTVNITGDATITLIVDESEGLLDKDQYYKELS